MMTVAAKLIRSRIPLGGQHYGFLKVLKCCHTGVGMDIDLEGEDAFKFRNIVTREGWKEGLKV